MRGETGRDVWGRGETGFTPPCPRVPPYRRRGRRSQTSHRADTVDWSAAHLLRRHALIQGGQIGRDGPEAIKPLLRPVRNVSRRGKRRGENGPAPEVSASGAGRGASPYLLTVSSQGATTPSPVSGTPLRSPYTGGGRKHDAISTCSMPRRTCRRHEGRRARRCSVESSRARWDARMRAGVERRDFTGDTPEALNPRGNRKHHSRAELEALRPQGNTRGTPPHRPRV